MSDGMRRELVYLSSYATNRYFIPNWGNLWENITAEGSVSSVKSVGGNQLGWCS